MELSQDETFAAYYNYLMEQRQQEIEFTRSDAHRMLIETHRKSVSATEELLVTKELIALHGVAVPKTQVNINHTNGTVVHKNDYRTLPDDKLHEMIGADVTDLEPELIDYDESADG